MIVEDKYFKWCRIELAISPELQRDLCHSLGFAGSIDSKSVSFALGNADNCVEKRRGEKQ